MKLFGLMLTLITLIIINIHFIMADNFPVAFILAMIEFGVFYKIILEIDKQND